MLALFDRAAEMELGLRGYLCNGLLMEKLVETFIPSQYQGGQQAVFIYLIFRSLSFFLFLSFEMDFWAITTAYSIFFQVVCNLEHLMKWLVGIFLWYSFTKTHMDHGFKRSSKAFFRAKRCDLGVSVKVNDHSPTGIGEVFMQLWA